MARATAIKKDFNMADDVTSPERVRALEVHVEAHKQKLTEHAEELKLLTRYVAAAEERNKISKAEQRLGFAVLGLLVSVAAIFAPEIRDFFFRA